MNVTGSPGCWLTTNQSTSSEPLAHVIMLRSKGGAIFEIKVDGNLNGAKEIANIIKDRMSKLISNNQLNLSEKLIKKEIKHSAGVPHTESIQVTTVSKSLLSALSPAQKSKNQDLSPSHTLKIICFGIENNIKNADEMRAWFTLLENSLKSLTTDQRSDFIKSFLSLNTELQQKLLDLAPNHIENWENSILSQTLDTALQSLQGTHLETLNKICDGIETNKKFTMRPLFKTLESELQDLPKEQWPDLVRVLVTLPDEQRNEFIRLAALHVKAPKGEESQVELLLNEMREVLEEEESIESDGVYTKAEPNFEGFYYAVNTNPIFDKIFLALCDHTSQSWQEGDVRMKNLLQQFKELGEVSLEPELINKGLSKLNPEQIKLLYASANAAECIPLESLLKIYAKQHKISLTPTIY